MLVINGLKFPNLLVVQSLIKLTYPKQLNVLVNIFTEKYPVQTYLIYLPIYTQCARKF